MHFEREIHMIHLISTKRMHYNKIYTNDTSGLVWRFKEKDADIWLLHVWESDVQFTYLMSFTKQHSVSIRSFQAQVVLISKLSISVIQIGILGFLL